MARYVKPTFSLILTFLIILVFSQMSFAQDCDRDMLDELQKEYKKIAEQLNTVTSSMGGEGITKDKYDELNTQREGLVTKSGDLKNKITNCKSKLDEGNKSKEYYNNGNLAVKTRRYAQAVGDFTKAVEIDPYFTQAYINMGVALLRLKKYPDAVEAYQKAIEIDPSQLSAYYQMGQAYAAMTAFEEAIAAYQKAVEINANYDRAWFGIGTVYYRQKEYTKAIESYRKSVEVNPNYGRAYHNLGASYMGESRFEEAATALEKASTIEPKNALIFFRLSRCYNKIGQYQKAIDAGTNSIGLSRKYAGGSAIEIGDAYKALGNTAKAIEFYTEARKDGKWRKNADYKIDLIKNADKYTH